MRATIRPFAEPLREIDVTHRIVGAIADELGERYGGSAALNQIEAEAIVERMLDSPRCELDERGAVAHGAPPPSHADIQRRAYDIYETRGEGPGDALSDWLQAERELIRATIDLPHRARSDVAFGKERNVTKVNRYVVTADGRRAVIYACRSTPGGAWHLDETRSLESTWKDLHEHHRPSLLGRGPSASAAQHYASPSHEDEEMERRFARDVGTWIDEVVDELRPEFVAVFAPARFLSALRNEVRRSSPIVECVEAELAQLRAGQLAQHPEVLRTLQASLERAATH